MKERAHANWIISAILISLSLALGLLIWFPPTEYSFYPKCVLYQATGLHCPGCGGTRAAHLLLQGRFIDACRMNVFISLFLPILFLVLCLQKLFIEPKKPFLALIAPPKIQWAIGMAVIAFGVARNLPWPPFCWLAPH